MADFEIMENPEYTEKIRKFEPTDPAHADLFNSVTEKMINNDAFLKKELDKQGTGTQEQFQQQYEQLTDYTDKKIAQLIDGAPETLDTLKEVADAIAENETVVEALNEAIGKKMDKSGLLDWVYPVGSIYMSVNSVNPGILFGGTWTTWGSGRVPIGVNVSDTEFDSVEKTGGSKSDSFTPSGTVGSHTLTASEIPSHTHAVPAHSHGLNSHTHAVPALSGTAASNGDHNHNPNGITYFLCTSGGAVTRKTAASGSTVTSLLYSPDDIARRETTSTNGAHTHTVTTSASTTGQSSGNTASSSELTSGGAGSGGSHNHTFSGDNISTSTVQPYITCYMWKRTA